ncbi:MAG: YceI family protein [Bacteroidota bacterium]
MKNLVLIFMAAVLLFACQSAQDKMSDAADTATDMASDAADAATDVVDGAADAAGEMMDDAANAIAGTYEDIKSALGENAMSITEGSSINWKATKAIGGGHEGTVGVSDGSISMNDSKISGAFTVDMTSMAVTDISAEEGAGDLIGHLSSPDFFDIANNPTANLVFTDIAVGDGGAFSGMARLDIKGMTSYNEISGNISKSDAGTMANVSMSFDRTAHEVMYGSAKLTDAVKDKIIDDTVSLSGQLIFN